MNNLDPVTVAVALLALLFGQELASIVGPYAIILLGSTLGAGWSLGDMERTTRAKAMGYFLRINVTALLITVPLVNILNSLRDDPTSQAPTWAITAVAVAIGLIGNNFPRVAKAIGFKLWDILWASIDTLRGSKKGGRDGSDS